MDDFEQLKKKLYSEEIKNIKLKEQLSNELIKLKEKRESQVSPNSDIISNIQNKSKSNPKRSNHSLDFTNKSNISPHHNFSRNNSFIISKKLNSTNIKDVKSE